MEWQWVTSGAYARGNLRRYLFKQKTSKSHKKEKMKKGKNKPIEERTGIMIKAIQINHSSKNYVTLNLFT